jgi:hypothetical protein
LFESVPTSELNCLHTSTVLELPETSIQIPEICECYILELPETSIQIPEICESYILELNAASTLKFHETPALDLNGTIS